ncbi:helix-turn-helix domain-containing protein [Streptomyces zaomyceticus]|uniref:helix-turn-helix domain-containing protein n=1 Tax=Streptomyces zaomyceticus TaxID=68286 RepID=UPI00379C609E
MTEMNSTTKTPACRRPRRRGRPSLLTPTVMDLLTRATAVGLPVGQAADAAGVSRSTLFRWLSRGEDVVEEKHDGQLDVNSSDPHAALYARVTRARAAAAVRTTGHIEEAARGGVVSETYRTWTDPITGEHRSERRIRRRPGDWRASAWLMDRLDPNPRSLDELLDEEDEKIRAERGDSAMERALTPHLRDLAERLQRTLARYQEEGTSTQRENSTS